MKNFLYIAIIFFSVSGCKPGIPKDILQPDDMAKVLHDIHIADGLISIAPGQDSAKRLASSYYKGIYKKFGIDSALYNKSMNYYYSDPKVLNDIYLKVTGNLNREKNEIVRADSVETAKEVMKIKMKFLRDSTNKADSIFWANILLKDTVNLKGNIKLKNKLPDSVQLKDTVKKNIDVFKLKMRYKELKF